jgi:hypothetical protein
MDIVFARHWTLVNILKRLTNMSIKHWPPRKGELVRDSEYHEGVIVRVSREDEEVVVRFPGRKVITEYQEFEWNGHTCVTFYYRVNGILYNANNMPTEWLRPVTRALDSYSFDDLNGCWISSSISDGGYWQV